MHERLVNQPEMPPNPEEMFVGVQGYEITTSGWLFNPETAFKVAHTLNENRQKQGKELLKLEVYATQRPAWLDQLAQIKGFQTLEDYLPPQVTTELIYTYLKQYPLARISDVHAEFNFSKWEQWLRILGEDVFPKLASSTPTERITLGLKNKIYQAAWIAFFGPASNRRSVDLASELNSEYGGVGLTMHPNIVEGFASNGQLEDIKKLVSRLLAENERPYNLSPHLERAKAVGSSPRDLLSDPETVSNLVVHFYGLDGMVLGADHLTQRGENLTVHYQKTANAVRKIHVSGSEGTRVHTAVAVGSLPVETLLQTVAHTEHPGRLTVALDYSPFEIGKLPFEDQLSMVEKTINWMESISRD